MSAAAPLLVREAFKTSRLADFASRKELITQSGHPVEEWPLVVIKEGVDNAIDACEDAGLPPVIDISIDTVTGTFVITDNGPGVSAEIVDGLVDYSIRTSTNEAYVSPSRGRQGNALQTLLAMAFTLDGERGETLIEAHGIAYLVKFTIDPIELEPRVTVDRTPSSVKTGTRLTLRWPAKACHLIEAAEPRFLPLVEAYATWNPHVALRFSLNGEALGLDATAPGWSKWRGSDPIPAHWFNEQTFRRLLAAQVNRDRQPGHRNRSLRQVIGEFNGLTSTAKQAEILAELGAKRSTLAEFYLNGEGVNAVGVRRLLEAMQRHSRPVKAAALGIIGREHFHRVIIDEGGDADTFRYHKIEAEGADGLPFVVEAAFGSNRQQYGERRVLTGGINWSASIGGDPLRFPDYSSIDRVLSSQRVQYGSPVVVAVHVATPLPSFADRGKAVIRLTPDQAGAVTKAVVRVTEEWNKARLAEEKAREAAERAAYRGRRAAEREEDEHRKEERAKRRRQRATVIGTGVLYAEIATAAEKLGVSTNALAVLSDKHDPYLRDTTEGHRDGQWFAEQLNAHFPSTASTIHLRGLFYRIVSVGNVRRPGGSPFINDLECTVWLQKAAKSARWLDLVPFERIRDERNEPARTISYADTASAGQGGLTYGPGIEIPAFGMLLPGLL